MDAPTEARPQLDVASFDASQLTVYLKDVLTLALENRPEDPIAFASDYLRRVLGGAGAVARAHQYLALSPHTRRAFTDNALLAFDVLSGSGGDEEGGDEDEKPVPGRAFNQLIDALLEDVPCVVAADTRAMLKTNDDAEVDWWEFQRATKACFALRETLEELEKLYERRGAGSTDEVTRRHQTITNQTMMENQRARFKSTAQSPYPKPRSPGCCTRPCGWSARRYPTRGGP